MIARRALVSGTRIGWDNPTEAVFDAGARWDGSFCQVAWRKMHKSSPGSGPSRDVKATAPEGADDLDGLGTKHASPKKIRKLALAFSLIT